MPRLNDPATPFSQWPMTPAAPSAPPSPLVSTPPEAPTPQSEPSPPPASEEPAQNATQNYSSHESNPQAISFTQRSEPTNNAQRTSAISEPAPYADAGVTDDGVAYAGAAAIKGRDANTGIEMEIYSASVQVGAQNEAQVGMARLGISSDSGANNATMDIFTAQAHAGVYNKDGTTGINAGATAVAVGVEGTASTGASGVTGGVSIGVGAEYSAGVRDADGDGYGEIGLRGTLELGVGITIGIQIEDPRGWGVWDYFD